MIRVLSFYMIWMYQPLIGSQGMAILYYGFVHAGITGAEIIFMNNFSRLENIFGSKKRYLFGSALVTGISLLMLGINSYLPLTIILIMLVGGFGMSRHIFHQSYLNKYIESHNRATVISSMSMLYNFVKGALYPILGILVEWNLKGAFIVLGIVTIIFSIISKVEEEHLKD